MAVIYTGNFTNANGTLIHNHTADTGQAYSTNTGFEIQSNRLVATDTTTKITKVEGMVLGANYMIELDLYKFTNAGNIGISFGVTNVTATDVVHGYFFRVLSNGDLSLVIVTQFGAFTQWTWNPSAANNSALSTIRLEVTTGGGTGKGIRIFYGGVEQHFQETTVQPGDHLYIRSWEGVTATTGHHIDRLEYNDELPPPPSDAIANLSNPTVTVNSATSVTIGADTDQTDGTLYVQFNFDRSGNSPQHVKDNANTSVTVAGAGTFTVDYTGADGLIAGRKYFAHIVHENSFGISDVLDTEIFTVPHLSQTYGLGTYNITGTAFFPSGNDITDTATLLVEEIAPTSASIVFSGLAPEPEYEAEPIASSLAISGLTPVLEVIAMPTASLSSLTPIAGTQINITYENAAQAPQFRTTAGQLNKVSDNGSVAVVDVPNPLTFGNQTLKFESDIDILLDDGNLTFIDSIQIQVEAGYTYTQVTSIPSGSEYENDPNIEVGDFIYGHEQSGLPNFNFATGVGNPDPQAGGVVRYAHLEQ